MTQIDFYQILGVSYDATQPEIRAAFVRLSKQHHPDRAGTLPWRLSEIRKAYHCLSNASARAEHDEAVKANARYHYVRQKAVQNRLRRYDRRQPDRSSRLRRAALRTLLLRIMGIGAGLGVWIHLTR